MENISCNFCHAENTVSFLKTEAFNYVKCGQCGLVYQNPRPSFTELKKNVYIDKYFNYEFRNQDNFFNLMKLNLKDFGFDKISRGISGKKMLLDIGSATGLLLNHVKSMGWTPVGVELCRESAEYARKNFGIKIYNSYLENIRFKSASIDAVHMSHIIEHVPDPMQTLLEVRRILKKNGYLMLITPNIESFQAKFFSTKWRSAHKDHLHLFSTKTLMKYFQKTGFKVIKQFSYGGLAIGTAPKFIKHPVDIIVKRLNIGDVTAFLCQK